MLRRLALFASSLFMAASRSAADPGAAAVPASDPHIAIMGRVAFTDAGAARMAYPGIVVRFAYRGPAPVLHLAAASDDCWFNLSVNGWDPVAIRLNKGDNRVVIPAGPAPETGYIVELTRRTEAWQGIATFAGLELSEGCALLPPPSRAPRRLLFIGDSMTCGQYIDRIPPADDATARTSNAARAFGMVLGRRLGAEVHLVSYGGRGLTRDWQGKTDTGTAPQFFERALPDDPESRWNHGAYTPDAIVVCLGQNDLNSGLPDADAFREAWARFVARLREVHPGAAIVLAGSAMHGEEPDSEDGRRRAFLRRTIEGVIAARRDAGDERVAFAAVRKQPGTALDSHPVAFQHEQIAEDLLGPIVRLTGW